MQLVYLTLSRFRRFFQAEAQLHGRLMALVGPNEAGKSSLLDALERLNSQDEFPQNDISRDEELPDDHVVLIARFLLEDSDRNAISHLPGGHDAKWFVLSKLRDGTLDGEIEPVLGLELEPRRAVARTLNLLLRTKWALSMEETNEDTATQLSSVKGTLEAHDVLTEENRNSIEQLIENLKSASDVAPK